MKTVEEVGCQQNPVWTISKEQKFYQNLVYCNLEIVWYKL